MDSLVVSKINIDEEPRLAGAEGIAVIPTLVLYRNGKAVDSVTAPGSKAEITPQNYRLFLNLRKILGFFFLFFRF